MSHFLNEDQRAFRDAAEAFARKEIEPLANQIDHDEHTPLALTKLFAEQGFFGLYIPEEYGGSGADLTTACVVVEEIAKASPAFAGMVSVQMILCPEVVRTLATPEQMTRLLPPSATGEQLMAYSQTEPAGAANKNFHLTKLTPDGDGWRLNGAKLFCTQGEATRVLVMCKTEHEGQQGYGCVIVERDAPGFEVAPYEEKLGWRGTNTGSISFSDVRIERDDVLGDVLTGHDGFYMTANQASFLGHAASSLGCVEGLFAKTVEYVKDRELYGMPMSRLSPISDRLATIWSKIEAARALLYTGTRFYDEGRRDLYFGTAAKVFVCETAFECCHHLLQMWGGSGMMDSTGVNRYFRDARINLIAEASTEMHNARIARAVIGLA